MELKAKRDGLLATLYWTQSIVERRNAMPILANVLIEAQACGIPVITSNYSSFSEIIEKDVNGIMASGTDAASLCEAMIRCITNYQTFDRDQISERTISRFSFEQIGKMLDEIYNRYF